MRPEFALHLTGDIKLQPSAFAQILATPGLLISAKRI